MRTYLILLVYCTYCSRTALVQCSYSEGTELVQCSFKVRSRCVSPDVNHPHVSYYCVWLNVIKCTDKQFLNCDLCCAERRKRRSRRRAWSTTPKRPSASTRTATTRAASGPATRSECRRGSTALIKSLCGSLRSPHSRAMCTLSVNSQDSV